MAHTVLSSSGYFSVLEMKFVFNIGLISERHVSCNISCSGMQNLFIIIYNCAFVHVVHASSTGSDVESFLILCEKSI